MSFSLSGFSSFLLKEGKTPASIEHYIKHIKFLLKECPELTRDQIITFFERPISNTAKNKYLTALRAWGRYTNCDYTFIPYLKEEEVIKDYLTAEEVERFLALPPVDSRFVKEYELWSFFFAIGFLCGLRLAEIARIECAHIDFNRWVINVNQSEKGKTGHRIVPIPVRLRDSFKQYCEGKTGKVFITKNGTEFKESGWRSAWKTRINQLGIQRKVKPYSVRDSKANRLADSEIDTIPLMHIMGWKKVETAMKYIKASVGRLHKVNNKDPMLIQSIPLEERRFMVYEFAMSIGVNPKDL